jgi:hypothetical protein
MRADIALYLILFSSLLLGHGIVTMSVSRTRRPHRRPVVLLRGRRVGNPARQQRQYRLPKVTQESQPQWRWQVQSETDSSKVILLRFAPPLTELGKTNAGENSCGIRARASNNFFNQNELCRRRMGQKRKRLP